MTTLTEQRSERTAPLLVSVRERDLSGDLARERDLLAAVDVEEMKRTFLTSVSHALRTPLSSILGFAVTMARDDVRLSPEEQKEMVGRLERNARRLDALLGDMLELERLARGGAKLQRRPTDLVDLTMRSVRHTDLGARQVEMDLEPVIAAVDEGKVERIVEHLLLNADRHTPRGGRVWARIRGVADGVLISVDDEGPGIPDELKGVVFEPLRHGSTLSHAPGLGVGLALVAGYAELHGGRAWVQDRAHGGASFRVFLPDGE